MQAAAKNFFPLPSSRCKSARGPACEAGGEFQWQQGKEGGNDTNSLLIIKTINWDIRINSLVYCEIMG